MNDKSIMPFGKHKGEKLANVPASYLLWLYGEIKEQKQNLFGWKKELFEYIEDNMDVIDNDIKKEKDE